MWEGRRQCKIYSVLDQNVVIISNQSIWSVRHCNFKRWAPINYHNFKRWATWSQLQRWPHFVIPKYILIIISQKVGPIKKMKIFKFYMLFYNIPLFFFSLKETLHLNSLYKWITQIVKNSAKKTRPSEGPCCYFLKWITCS